MTIRLIYASQAVRPLDDADLSGLLDQARRRNSEHHVGGLLLYCNLSFLQVLEGSEESVDAVFASITRDQRHRAIRLLVREAVEDRRFDAWSMGFERIEPAALAAALPGFQPATSFPLVDSNLVRNARVAFTLLELYQQNPPPV